MSEEDGVGLLRPAAEVSTDLESNLVYNSSIL